LIKPHIQKLTINYMWILTDSENLDIDQSIYESSEGAKNASTKQEPNASDNLASAEVKPYLDRGSGNAARGKT